MKFPKMNQLINYNKKKYGIKEIDKDDKFLQYINGGKTPKLAVIEYEESTSSEDDN